MIGKILAINALLLIAYMSLWFVVARIRRRLDTVDTAWGIGFAVAAWSATLQQPSTRTLVIAILVSLWGLRLAGHIWQRSKNHKEDPRYEELSQKWEGNFWLRAYLSIFILQGTLVWVISLPVVLAAGEQLDGLDWFTMVGVSVWLIGFAIEAIADQQLRKFIKTENHPKVLQTGLWRYSRHPNYFGELTMWWGIGVIALQCRYGWIGLIGPLTLTILILFVSGIPPIERRRSEDSEYQEYQNRTSPLVPLPPRN